MNASRTVSNPDWAAPSTEIAIDGRPAEPGVSGLRTRNNTRASSASHSMTAPMVMRSHTPAHGVGRSPWIREASDPDNAPHPARITIVAIDGVEAESAAECRGTETQREQHEDDCRDRPHQ